MRGEDAELSLIKTSPACEVVMTYAVFGKVVEGMDIVDKIKAVPAGAKNGFSKDCPLTDVVIQSATRLSL